MQRIFGKYSQWASIGAVLMALVTSAAYAAPVKVGIAAAVNPAAKIKDTDSHEQTLMLGNNINFKEVVTTDKEGSAQLIFLDRSALTVGQNASVVIDKFVYNPDKGTGDLVINASKGVFRFVGGALSKQHPVTIKTPVSTVGIRGGIAIIDINPVTGATNAIFAYGKEMTVQNMAGDIQSTTTPGTQIAVASAITPPTPPVKVEPAALIKTMDKMESQAGQNGGAQIIPDAASLKTVANVTGMSGNTLEENSSTLSNTNLNANNPLNEKVINNAKQTTNETESLKNPNILEKVKNIFVNGKSAEEVINDRINKNQSNGNQGSSNGNGNGSSNNANNSNANNGNGNSGGGNSGGGSSGGSANATGTGPTIDPTGYASWDKYLNTTSAAPTNATNKVLLLDNSQRTRCSTCSYVDWGVWAADVNDVNAPIDLSTVGFRVGGTVTQGLGSLGLPNGVSYSGMLIGNMTDTVTSTTTNHTGNFSANVDFANRELTDFTANFAGRQFGFAGASNSLPIGGNAKFGNFNVGALDAGNAITGTMNGAFFGPNAEEIGGNFSINTTDGSGHAQEGNGVYVGKH